MTQRDLDPSVERFARVTPPPGHEARILARSGPRADLVAGAPRPWTVGAWRWAVPAAASVLLFGVAAWHGGRVPVDAGIALPPASVEWSGKGVDVPVLPPRAYWEMSAVDEFARLRPPAPSDPASAVAARERRASATGVEGVTVVGDGFVDADVPWTPLAPIQLVDITPDPIELPGLTPLEPLELEPIHLMPIDIVPMDKEQQ